MPPENNTKPKQFVEYYSTPNLDLECIRSNYKNIWLHIITIKDSLYVLADDVCNRFDLPDDVAVQLLAMIPDSDKTTGKLRRVRGDAEYELAMLTEKGLCRLVELINSPEAYDFLHDVQEMLNYKNKTYYTDAVTRIAMQFAKAKRRRLEANPDGLQPLDLGVSNVLSAPSLYRGRLNRYPIQPSSVLTIAASTQLQAYQDASGNLWFDTRQVMKALGHSSVADPSTVFGNVPPCWLAEVEVENPEGGTSLITCILLHGILFYLSDSTNLYSVYLMYYIAFSAGMRNKDGLKCTADPPPLITNRLPLGNHESSEDGKQYVRWLMDRSGSLCYILGDILKALNVEKEEADRVLQKIPVKFKKTLLIQTGSEAEEMMCLTGQGLWFILSTFSEKPDAQKVIQKLADFQPAEEDCFSLLRTQNGWKWPYLSDPDQIPSYESQIRGFEIIYSSYSKQNLTEWGIWGLNAIAEMTTGISPLAVIHRWEKNKEKEEEKLKEKETEQNG